MSTVEITNAANAQNCAPTDQPPTEGSALTVRQSSTYWVMESSSFDNRRFVVKPFVTPSLYLGVKSGTVQLLQYDGKNGSDLDFNLLLSENGSQIIQSVGDTGFLGIDAGSNRVVMVNKENATRWIVK